MAADGEPEAAAGRDGGDGRPAEGDGDERDDGHLADLPDGCGCAEVWEHLSGKRDG